MTVAPETKTKSVLYQWAEEAVEHGMETEAEQVAWILEHQDWDDLDVEYRAVLLRTWIHANGPMKMRRHDAITGSWRPPLAGENGDGPSEPTFRILADGVRAWDASWNVGGRMVQTSDLTVDDVAHLKSVYKRKATELLARLKWLDLLEQEMRRHDVKTAGQLRKKGVGLPSVEWVEAGE